MITIEDLEKIGIIRRSPKVYPDRFFIPGVNEVYLLLTKDFTWKDIYEGIYNQGFRDGEKVGEKKKSASIKKLLDID